MMTKEDKKKYFRDYMSKYRLKHPERIKAQKNLNRDTLPDVFINNSF